MGLIKQILFIGANFRNKGAEAMALTAVEEFHQRYPQARLIVASYAAHERIPYAAHKTERGAYFELIRNTRTMRKVFLVFAAALARRREKRSLCAKGDSYLQTLAASDLVVDLSGFAFSDQRPFLRRLIYCFEIFTSQVFKVPFVVFTQALGPFEKLSTKLLARYFLPQTALIISRGEATKHHLQKLKLPKETPIYRAPDAAYLFRGATMDEFVAHLRSQFGNDYPLVGVVPNINIFQRSYPRTLNNPYLRQLQYLAQYAQTKIGVNLLFITHESSSRQNNDAWLSEQILHHLKGRQRTLMLGGEQSAAELKGIIARLDFIIASRFHALVAAISSAVPFLAIGWSHKYVELVEEAGVAEAIVDGRYANGGDLAEKFAELFSARDELKAKLIEARLELAKDAKVAFDLVKERFP